MVYFTDRQIRLGIYDIGFDNHGDAEGSLDTDMILVAFSRAFKTADQIELKLNSKKFLFPANSGKP